MSSLLFFDYYRKNFNYVAYQFNIKDNEGYFFIIKDENEKVRKIDFFMKKESERLENTLRVIGQSISLCLDYGVEIDKIIQKYESSLRENLLKNKKGDFIFILDYSFSFLKEKSFFERKNI